MWPDWDWLNCGSGQRSGRSPDPDAEKGAGLTFPRGGILFILRDEREFTDYRNTFGNVVILFTFSHYSHVPNARKFAILIQKREIELVAETDCAERSPDIPIWNDTIDW